MALSMEREEAIPMGHGMAKGRRRDREAGNRLASFRLILGILESQRMLLKATRSG